MTGLRITLCVLCGMAAMQNSLHAQVPDKLNSLGYTELVFNEEFSGNRLDEDRWMIDTWRQSWDEPFEVFGHSDAVEVRNGKLTLSVFERNPGEDKLKNKRFRVGRIQTRTWEKDRFEATFGYIEARIKCNTQPGTNAAFWLHSRKAQAGRPFLPGWPKNQMELELNNPDEFLRQAGAEIDVVEALAEHRFTREDDPKRRPGDPVNQFIDFRDRWVINLHWNGYRDDRTKWEPGQLHQSKGVHLPLPDGKRTVGDWHVFGLHWTPQYYEFFMDGDMLWQTSQGVSHQPEFLILSIGVSNGSFAGEVPSRGYGGRTSDRNPTMKVDWVRWHQTPEQAAVTRAAGH